MTRTTAASGWEPAVQPSWNSRVSGGRLPPLMLSVRMSEETRDPMGKDNRNG
jgi:hypothetical protein